MKKFIFIPMIALSFMTSTVQSQSSGQSDKVGKVDSSGNISLDVGQPQGINILRDHSVPGEAQAFHATEVLFTQMADGSICFTGYQKNPSGHIIKGFRIVCFQDDENNLIVKRGNKRERVSGRPF